MSLTFSLFGSWVKETAVSQNTWPDLSDENRSLWESGCGRVIRNYPQNNDCCNEETTSQAVEGAMSPSGPWYSDDGIWA